MAFYQNSLGLQILQHLNRSGQMPRKNLYTPFVSYAYEYYRQVVQKLIEDGYIQISKDKRKRINCVSITAKGQEELLKHHNSSKEEAETIKKETGKAKTPKEKKRAKLVADVEGLCIANDFLVSAAEKPSFASLFSDDECVAEEFAQAVEQGVYYTTKEIRDAYISLIGKNEIANWTRLIGVLFRNRSIFFLYSVDKVLIKWMASCEERTVGSIIDFIKRSGIITDNILILPAQTCVVCGEGMTMIPKIVTGRKWGRTREGENSERYRKKAAASSINSHNLSKVFCVAYYVPGNKTGVEMFNYATGLTEQNKERLADNWFNSITTAIRLKTLSYHQGVTTNNKNERVVFIPCVDLIELEFLKGQNVPCHMIVPKGTEQGIARVMGPLILSMRSITGEILSFERYDETGAPLNADPEKEKNKFKKFSHPETDRPKKESLQLHIDPKIKSEFKKKLKVEGKNASEEVERMIRVYLEEGSAGVRPEIRESVSEGCAERGAKGPSGAKEE